MTCIFRGQQVYGHVSEDADQALEVDKSVLKTKPAHPFVFTSSRIYHFLV